MLRSVSIIYPVFNEEKRLGKIFSDIKKFEGLTNYIDKEYIFVNDGSTDNSLSLIKKKSKKKQKIQNYYIQEKYGKRICFKKGGQICKKKVGAYKRRRLFCF